MKQFVPLGAIALMSLQIAVGVDVEVLSVPHGGIQPQAAVDESGALHVVYFKGDPSQGDLFYVRRFEGQAAFSAPIRVNTVDGSAIAAGAIRGASLALDDEGRPHVAWMGSGKVAEESENGGHRQHPMLYTRFNEIETKFEPSQNVVTWTRGIDGGGSVAADSRGNVFVAWHGSVPENENGEFGRAVYVARSDDGGETFSRETRVNVEPTGSCACCGIRAFVDVRDHWHLLYRTANSESRDMRLLTSTDFGGSYMGATINQWAIQSCPMSSATMCDSPEGLYLATERGGAIELARRIGSSFRSTVVASSDSKYPSIAVNKDGETLVAWTEGASWAKAGFARWKVFDHNGELISEGDGGAMQVWSFPTVVAPRNDQFVILR